MRKQLVPVLLLLVLFLPFGFSSEALGQKKSASKTQKKSRLTRTSIRKTKGSQPKTRADLPGFANSPMFSSSVATLITKCSADKKVLFFNIYKANLFFERMMLYDGQIMLVALNGTHVPVSSQPTIPSGYDLLQKIVVEFKPTFMELQPGKEAMLSTLVLSTDQLTEDQIYLVYGLLREYLTGSKFTVNFLNTCRYISVPETKPSVSESVKSDNPPPMD